MIEYYGFEPSGWAQMINKLQLTTKRSKELESLLVGLYLPLG